jgi:hypothetical protein
VTFPSAISAPLFPSNSEKPFLIISTMLLTPGGSPPVVLFYLGLCGAYFIATTPPGQAGVWPASGARSIATRLAPQPIPIPQWCFSHLHVDLVGPLHCHETVPEPFSYPARRFLHTRDRRRLHSLHRRGIRPVNEHHQRG